MKSILLQSPEIMDGKQAIEECDTPNQTKGGAMVRRSSIFNFLDSPWSGLRNQLTVQARLSLCHASWGQVVIPLSTCRAQFSDRFFDKYSGGLSDGKDNFSSTRNIIGRLHRRGCADGNDTNDNNDANHNNGVGRTGRSKRLSIYGSGLRP
jgi:hypothetical protein